MKTFINHQKVNARARLSNLASVGGLLLLLVSVVIPLFRPAWAGAAYILMIVGLGISMIGIYFANRWVRKPRPEDSLAKALKSLDDQYQIYHYPALPCDHLLLTPGGVVELEVINLAGSFSYHDGKWREAMTIGRALRYIVEERISNPILAAQRLEDEVSKLISKELDGDIQVPVRSAVVFTHPLVQLDLEKTPITVCRVDKLKKQVINRGARLPLETIEKVAAFLQSKTV